MVRRNLIRTWLLAFVLLGATLLGCAGSGPGTTESEENGWNVTRLTGIYPEFDRKVAGTYGQVEFGIERRLSPSGDSTDYAITATTLTANQLLVRRGNEMDIIVDRDDTLRLLCTKAVDQPRTMRMGNPETGRGVYYLETLWYRVTREGLAQMAFATSIAYTIHGFSDTLRGDFTDDNIEAYRTFYTEQVH